MSKDTITVLEDLLTFVKTERNRCDDLLQNRLQQEDYGRAAELKGAMMALSAVMYSINSRIPYNK